MSISDYEFVQELAVDEWHVLQRAICKQDNQHVLLKAPRRDFFGGLAASLLAREFELLRDINVAGVPSVLGMQNDSSGCFVVMEDNGATTLELLLRKNKLPLEAILKIGIQIATIIAELHQLNVIHGAVSPQSILVHPETGSAELVNFSLARWPNGEAKSPSAPQLLREGLAYISPEQTGRMNRAVDYRSDLYSLGATLYEMLTGARMFLSDDALEVIHWHIAKTPKHPSEINSEVPEQVSRIVIKLLSKTAEDRYQSALGLRRDLETCAEQWTTNQRISAFLLGQHDIWDRFLIPQKLYGREQKLEQLLGLFDHVCQGHTAVMLVAGYSGIGKTSLIQELYKPIVRERGYFISGKFDQVVRNIPFGALIQAFRGLVGQLLTESEERLAQWRARLSEALGTNGGVLAEVVPEIELIIGKQPATLALGPTEALNRFQLVLQNFLGALARPEHPLVIFLDDLQWADPATLSLLQPLLTSKSIQYLFLIGAYRDNEVDAAHPLTRTQGSLEAAGVDLHRVTLLSLKLPDLTVLIRDTLHGQSSDAAPLVDLVLEKTGGNPFFVIQFLGTLRQEGFLKFDYARGRWTYRIDDIAGAAMTDNVIDLMTRKIQQLSSNAQHALTLASCIGNPFDQNTLAIVSEQTSEDVADDLSEALNEGLILPATIERRWSNAAGEMRAEDRAQFYAFLHDRVQQAAYALIPQDRKHIVHHLVGRLLLQRADLEQTEEKLFDIVHHLNLGSSLITEESERLALARLNLNASGKAKSSTAYQSALNYAKAGLSLLSEERWESHYDLVFALNFEAAACQYLCGNFDEAEQQFESLVERAKTALDKARVYNLRSVQYENMSRYADALAVARESLALFGVSFPDAAEEKQAALESEIESIQSLLGHRSIESLVDLPIMTHPETRMVMTILTDMWSSAYILGDVILARLISATMVRLSLIHGNLEESAYGYVTHAITVGPVREDYESAYEFGKLALRVNERFNDSRRRAKIHQQFHAHVNLWRQPMHTCIPYAREACRSGLEAGDFLYAAYGASTEAWPAIVSTQDLAQFVRDYTPNLELIKKLKIVSFGDALMLMLSWARALQGETEAPMSVSHEAFDEKEYADTYSDNPFFTTFYAVARLNLYYVFEEYEKALEAARVARQTVYQLSGTIWPVMFDFWNGLTLAANYADATEDERRIYLEEMERARATLATLARNCPENFLCQSLLLSAELELIAGRHLSALEGYEQAIRYASDMKQVQNRALASELCAKFWYHRGLAKVAAVFLADAREAYSEWGASAKVRDINTRYSELLGNESATGLYRPEASSVHAATEDLDIATALKAAQAIANEIELERLLKRLMQIAIENAGAERGSLILEKEGKPFINAQGAIDTIDVTIKDAIPLEQSSTVSAGIVNYVRRTLASVVLADARTDSRYAGDAYVATVRPRSIMSTPIVNQGCLIGVLYLENNLVPNAFTADRIKVMQLVSSEAAIALENARLYEDMKQEVTRRQRAEETLRSITEGTAGVTGGDFFYSLVRHLATALNVRHAFVTRCNEERSKARTLAFWNGAAFLDNFEYELEPTPCAKVLHGETCFYSDNLQELFPRDIDLAALNAQSFFGVPLSDSFGRVIGHLAVMDERPMDKDPGEAPILKIFAARAAAELERLKAEEGLRAALTEVEQLKNRLQAENIYLQEEISKEHHFTEIVGSSPPLLKLLGELERVAPTDATVLILGETGTGKELIARALHSRSPRKDRPLVKVNCGAIAAGLVESELFGHVKGAFTGAIGSRVGRFELADGGTLFLDEVSELPPEAQVKLLRVLQEGEFEAVGSSRTISVNVRTIAATNRDLEAEVGAGRFRADLFYRLNVFPLSMPPLRERPSDISQLVMFFLARFSKKFGKKVDSVTRETMGLLTSYAWPGNIRELENLIERGVVLSRSSVLNLSSELFSAHTFSTPESKTVRVAKAAASSVEGEKLPSGESPSYSQKSADSLEDVERRHILGVLAQTSWVIEGPKGAALILNLHPNTLRSRMKKLGISRAH